jgi:hypothetical protein
MNRIRSSYETTRAVTAYREQGEGDAEEFPIRANITIFAAVADDETRMLHGKPVNAVLFTLDTNGWYWMPRSEFLRSTEKVDVKTQTGIPFQR